MILYIGWTNLMLLNVYNIHITKNKDKEAILLVIDSNSVNPDIISFFLREKPFNDLYILPTEITISEYTTRKQKLMHLPEVLLYSNRILRYYESTLPLDLKEYTFNEVYVPGFFYNVVFFLEVISRHNKIEKIKYYDFGLGSYTRDPHSLSTNLEFMTAADRFIRTLNEFFYRKKFLPLLSKELFVYQPEITVEDENYVSSPIQKFQTSLDRDEQQFLNTTNTLKNDEIPDGNPGVLPTNPLLESLFKRIPNVVQIALKKRDFIYFFSYGPDSSEEIKIFEKILAIADPKKVILKAHTQAPSLLAPLTKKFKNKCYVDTNNYLFEAFPISQDFSNKVLISRFSTGVCMPKFIFDQEPILIFTYKLFNIYKKIGNIPVDEFMERFRDCYSEPEKIMVPASELEFKLMLKKAQRMINRQRIFFEDDFFLHDPELLSSLKDDSYSEQLETSAPETNKESSDDTE